MSQTLTSRWDWAAWTAVLAASIACGAQAAWRAWPEYELASADPTFRRQAPETLARVRRASALEMDGQPKAAEHELLIAAADDRRFLSAWALANFYRRQGRSADFWPWARRAIEMSHGDRTALFALLLEMAPPTRVRAELPAHLHSGFGTYLVSVGRLDDAVAAVASLDEAASRILTERLIAVGRFYDALAVWNESQNPRLDPARPSIVNSDFQRPPGGLGFDWRLGSGATQSGGRLVIPADAPGEFASQYLVLSPDRRYRLTVEHDGSGATGKLRWQIDDIADRRNLLSDAPAVNASLNRQSFEFRTSSRTKFARLALASSAPVPGVSAIRRVSLGFAD